MARRLIVFVAMLCQAMLVPVWGRCGVTSCAPTAAVVGAADSPGCCGEDGIPSGSASAGLCCCDTGDCCADVDRPQRSGEAIEPWRDPSSLRVLALAVNALYPRVIDSGGALGRVTAERRARPDAPGERRALLCVRTV